MISPSDRALAVELIQEANQNGARLALACKELNISVRTYERWVSEGGVKEDQRPIAPRPEPKNKLTEEEKMEILEVVKKEEFANLPPTQIVPKLADQSIYIASESSFYRVLREQNMQNHRGRSKRPESRLPESHLAKAPNQVWTWDITWLKGPVKGIFYRLYLILDLFSRKIVGWEIWETEEAKYAEELVKKTIVNEKIQGRPLVLHSDNGSPKKAATFQVLLEKLGIQSSYSRPRVSNDNPYSKAMFRTLKYRPEYLYKGFGTLDAAREWALKFVHWYNCVHLHSGTNFVTPEQCHTGAYAEVLNKRKEVYEQAKQKRPERWTRSTRDWSPHDSVALNPMKESLENGSQ
ncbi:IS3 family transposase [Neobacillus sp. MM2021_6]|uniref:IS3 family transposase n=1 Tax=Bacillaceae TaxID=186817 RepID=UPI00140E0A12|nr:MULTISPECIES: IS3 family transposase [Bacillaceae]MBO0959950.1 IS3 family transposase [Neobacillus sp. MM2021_6]NHC18900.1 IS3 family transposase [Bacillus sp. MM2020_4]